MNRRVLYAQYGNPAAYPPLMHSVRLLAERGREVLALGIEDAATRELRFPPMPRVRVKQLAGVALGWRRRFYFLYFTLWMVWNALAWRAAWVYASDLFATPGALALSYVPGVRVVYHEHDAPQGVRGVAKACLAARRRLAARAAVCVFPNGARAERFASEEGMPKEMRVVWNCPERAEVLSRPTREDGVFRLVYHGTLVPARLPLTVVEALAQLPREVCLRVAGYETVGHAGYLSELFERARALGVAERMEWVGAATREELLAFGRECEVGLALMPKRGGDWNEQTMAGASNKPFDYMACGLGLIVSDLPDWRGLFVETGFGRACDPGDAESIANAVRWYLDHPEERAAVGARAQEKIFKDWNYEREFASVMQVMERG
jgi:glycosyltransferase involved in cell wall biosynthesis